MISIISSTNRKEAVTYKICLQYQTILKELSIESQIIDLEKLPDDFIFSALYDQSGKNNDFNNYRQLMKESSKYVFVVPEYNGSFPGVLKAFIDGLEYPNTFRNKKCALVGLSSGVQGAGLALSHLTDIFNYCGMHVLASKPKLARIETSLSENQEIVNPVYLELLEEQARQLIEF